MNKILGAVGAGAAIIGIIGAAAYYLNSMEVFVITSLIVIALLFIPLLVQLMKIKGGSKPTLFGASKPGSFSTISHAQEKGETRVPEKVYIAAIAGLAALLIFLLAAAIQLL
ncbi:hypothetical protein [Alkalicoccus daliensis]|uniref:DUF3899 domain-containing protein n=1 Tax=Alkalicoccus daliensis TaxID=745820 RepID=A0A1H0HUI7_9BACI|nr:hypothetical protein [Alkalicoccus daliensis]SDO22882.1 hypothetical protein SAMN04488053_10950 [Alkalicoccus daliensis]